MAFLNAPACAGEVNAKVTENDALSMRVDLKNADRDSSNAAGTDRSIQNLVFCTVEYLLLGPHDRE